MPRSRSYEGYAAVTARKVAGKAGLKVQLVYYYFQTMDDLILAVIRKNTAKRLERFAQALVSAEPLRALWELNSDPSYVIPATELVALETIAKQSVPKSSLLPDNSALFRSPRSAGCWRPRA